MNTNVDFYDKRAHISIDYLELCGYGCKYCLSQATTPVNTYDDLDEIVQVLSEQSNQFEIVGTGCEQELFLCPEKAIEVLRKFSGLNKIITFATKSSLSDDTIEQLQSINDYLKENGSYLFLHISMISGVDRFDIEPYAPSITARIETARKLTDAGIYVSPLIRPILPDEIVPVEDIIKLIDDTKDFIKVYTLGDLYFNDQIGKIMKLDELDDDFWKKVEQDVDIKYLKDEIGFNKYVDPDKKTIIEEHIRSHGREVFDTSTEAILHHRNSSNPPVHALI